MSLLTSRSKARHHATRDHGQNCERLLCLYLRRMHYDTPAHMHASVEGLADQAIPSKNLLRAISDETLANYTRQFLGW